MIEGSAGLARVLAEARQGLTPEHSFGGEDACHRTPMIRDRVADVNGISGNAVQLGRIAAIWAVSVASGTPRWRPAAAHRRSLRSVLSAEGSWATTAVSEPTFWDAGTEMVSDTSRTV